MSDIILYGLGGLIFYQAYATIRVVRHKSCSSEKKRHQLLIIWLVPFVGATIALAGLASVGEAPVRLGKDVVPKKTEQSRSLRTMQSNPAVNLAALMTVICQRFRSR